MAWSLTEPSIRNGEGAVSAPSHVKQRINALRGIPYHAPAMRLSGTFRATTATVDAPRWRDYAWGGDGDVRLSRAPHWGELAYNVYFAQGFSGHGIAATGLAGRVIAEAIPGHSERLDVFGKLRHLPFPGGRLFRTPMRVAAMAWYKLRDAMW